MWAHLGTIATAFCAVSNRHPCALRMSRHQPRLFRILHFEIGSGLTIQTPPGSIRSKRDYLRANALRRLNFASTCPSVSRKHLSCFISQHVILQALVVLYFANTCPSHGIGVSLQRWTGISLFQTAAAILCAVSLRKWTGAIIGCETHDNFQEAHPAEPSWVLQMSAHRDS